MPLRLFRRQYEQLSQFERGRIIGMMEALWSARRVVHQLGRFNCVVRRRYLHTQRPGSGRPRQTNCREDRHIAQVAPSLGAAVSSRTIRRRLAEGHLRSQRPLRVLPLTPTHQCLRLECCRARENWTAAEWNQVVFSDESRFNLSSDDNRVRVGSPRGKRLNPSFALQRHTAPTGGVLVWGVIAYNTRSPLVLIRDTMTAQRYVHDILQPHVLPLMQWLSEAIFQQDNARPHMARVSHDCLFPVTIHTWHARSPDLSPIEDFWDHLGRQVGHPMSLNELEAWLLQIWNEMSQDILQNLYASMADSITSCIRARGSSTGH
ncbi:transposable element Tcb2 transposase [Trichonephila clavipes]|uniref:Transposable element Tcb2 transposase n=1 Tax=Trichonephila clavipes TaxID=2585209 RepID=A0A8X6SQU2_TRICX|nr:transposable element Tcb2 transposase [Trichonephila clavipes]